MSVWTDRKAWTIYALTAGAVFWWTGGVANIDRAKAVAEATGARDPAMVRNCEAAVQNRLSSPSGYKRIRVAHAVEQMTRDEVAQRSQGNAFGTPLYRFTAGEYRPQVWRVVIEFDAPNGFGAPIRMMGLCESYFSADARMEVIVGPRPAS